MTQGRTACRWHIRAGENETKEIPAFFRRHSITDGLARILMRRGLDTEDKLSHFLYDDLSDLSDPFLMKGMKEGVTRLLSAIDRREKIVVYGDYDVDGITSTSILVRCLKGMGADVVLASVLAILAHWLGGYASATNTYGRPSLT